MEPYYAMPTSTIYEAPLIGVHLFPQWHIYKQDTEWRSMTKLPATHIIPQNAIMALPRQNERTTTQVQSYETPRLKASIILVI